MDADNYKGFALLGPIATLETLGLLVRKGIITPEDGAEAIDRCLLNLETRSATAAADDLGPLSIARQICEVALAELDEQGRNPRSRRGGDEAAS
jgi:hypothetical protein